MSGAFEWPRSDAESIARALSVEGGHLFVGHGGYTLSYALGATSSGYEAGRIQHACLSAGLPVIDTRMLDFDLALQLACRSPMIAVGEPPRHAPTDSGPDTWGPLSYAPLAHVAEIYRAAGAEISNLPPPWSRRRDGETLMSFCSPPVPDKRTFEIAADLRAMPMSDDIETFAPEVIRIMEAADYRFLVIDERPGAFGYLDGRFGMLRQVRNHPVWGPKLFEEVALKRKRSARASSAKTARAR